MSISMDEDPFESLFNLEDQYFDEGYKQGYADGLYQSHAEAEQFGIEQGFKKFTLIAELHAQAAVWSEKLSHGLIKFQDDRITYENTFNSVVRGHFDNPSLNHSFSTSQNASSNAETRLQRHVDILLALTDPTTLSLENTDDAISDFDNRLKRAQAKLKVIEKVFGDSAADSRKSQNELPKNPTTAIHQNGNIEDFGKI